MYFNKRIMAFLLTVSVSFVFMAMTSPDIVKGVRLGLDLKGGFEVLYKAEPLSEDGQVTGDSLRQTARSLEQRIDALGTTEPEILPEGEDRIRVRIAGVEDESSIRELLKKPAVLTFKGPDGSIKLQGNDFVEGAAEVGFSQTQQPIIQIEVKDKEKLKQVSEELLYQPLAIYLDDQMISAPVVQGIFTDGRATISGSYSYEEAKELADIINLGALPLKLTEIYTQSVGASLGQQSLEQTMQAGIVASIFILLFMVALYRIPGIVAGFTLITYTWSLLLVFYWLQATLTLPGIAAFILGIGMAVDANIITYERLKDEIRTGKSLLSSLRSGSKHSIRTIIDSNFTTVIAAAVLFSIGTGAIKGFALTLMLSIGLSVLTNVFLSQWLLQLLIKSNAFRNPGYFGVKDTEIADIREAPPAANRVFQRWNFVQKRKVFFAISILVTSIGTGSLLIQGMNPGVDFKAGTSLDISVNEPVGKAQAEEIVRSAGFEPSSVTIGGADQDRVSMRFDKILSADANETELVIGAFKQQFGDEVSYEENTVDPSMARELAYKALMAVGAASIGIVIYVTVRFEWRFALAAILALVHNAFFVISLFSIFRLEVNLPFIAAILTIIGYSINDTIVIFDRIRENLRFAKLKSFDDLSELVNRSIHQTLVRSVNTGITVLFATIALLIWGSPSIGLFSFAMAIGLLIGMYSSICIASQIWVQFKKRSMRLEA
ncbi:protein translocase subunit SecD [Paenibacillus alkalitolerans]|uniref:protein translocase subunit SecD n=1 Tax=Paenibacillus alkalitolerans TaxID=2799335 RepID=UPI001F4291A1|nr:protein translocase subunit SecD [Paenibacillus alkalitolerans]